MSDREHWHLLHHLRDGDLSRRDLVRGASVAAITAGGMALPEALAQDATPAATPMATPAASPVAAGGPSFFDSDEHRMVMTFNVGHAGNEELWEERKEVLLELIQRNRPLLIGTQEPLHIQLDYLQENMPDYDYIGVSRQGNMEDEYNAILFDTTQVTVEDEGTYWLSENPSEPGSMMPGVGHPRIVTWGRFSIEGHPNSIYMFNTHLSFEEGVVEPQVEVLLEQMEGIVPENAEVILTGDFNRPRTTHVWQRFQDAGFQDAWQMAEIHAGPPTTFHGWEGLDAQGGFEQGLVADEADYQIDWILYRPGGALPANRQLLTQVVTYHEGDIYPSDHFPVALMTLGDPAFEVSDLQVSPVEVIAHEPLEMSATVTNNGESGVEDVVLYVDRLPVDSQWVVLEAGESREVSFERRLHAPGEHEVSIQLLPPEIVMVEGTPATLVFLGLDAEPYINPGQVIPVTARVENRGSFDGTVDVDFYVDDMLMESAPVSVPPGGIREIGFVQGFEEPGAYQVAVGSQTADINVLEDFDGAWVFQRGDDPEWSDPGFDDSDWDSPIDFPVSWEEHDDYTEDFVYGWYRQTFTVPEEWEGRPVRLIVGQIDDADKTFLNGELIGETGRFPDDEGGFLSAWNENREYTVEPDLVNYGAENTIAVRIYDDLGGGGIHRGPLGLLPLDQDALEE